MNIAWVKQTPCKGKLPDCCPTKKRFPRLVTIQERMTIIHVDALLIFGDHQAVKMTIPRETSPNKYITSNAMMTPVLEGDDDETTEIG